ncbi:unnamed protein product [Rhizophagus irregularis]|nr:unnamed protein product [Rhizophagus irregularis]
MMKGIKKSPVGEFITLRKKELLWLPPQLYYTKAIEVYLAQMKKLIQETLKGRCPIVKFPQQVDFVLTISAEWPP